MALEVERFFHDPFVQRSSIRRGSHRVSFSGLVFRDCIAFEPAADVQMEILTLSLLHPRSPLDRVMYELLVPQPFDLRLALHGHGWVSLEPHRWREADQVFETVLLTDLGATDVVLRHPASHLTFELSSKRPKVVAEVRAQLSRMLRLDEDFGPFWRECKKDPKLRWVARRGAGRLMRSPRVFEDLMKLLFTTNCSWAATKKMTERLVVALGEVAPSGRRAFPSADRCAQMNEAFFREEVRAGYRASRALQLAKAFAEGELDDDHFGDPTLDTDELRRRLLALPGFGPYAAGQALRLFGHYDDLALDSWCRTKLAQLEGRKTPRRDRAIEQTYARYGTYRGLVLWMHLTADWHGGTKPRPASVLSPGASQE